MRFASSTRSILPMSKTTSRSTCGKHQNQRTGVAVTAGLSIHLCSDCCEIHIPSAQPSFGFRDAFPSAGPSHADIDDRLLADELYERILCVAFGTLCCQCNSVSLTDSTSVISKFIKSSSIDQVGCVYTYLWIYS